MDEINVDLPAFMSRMHDSISHELEKISSLFPEDQDPVLALLRGYLLTEYYLDKIIKLKLDRGEKIIKKGSLSYKQKVVLVESMAFLPDSVVICLKNLNSVRNKLAHELEATVDRDDIVRIGQPLGDEFQHIKTKHFVKTSVFLSKVLNLIFRDLHGHLFWLEEQQSQNKEEGTF